MSSPLRQAFPTTLASMGLEESTLHISPETVSRLKAACVRESKVTRPMLAAVRVTACRIRPPGLNRGLLEVADITSQWRPHFEDAELDSAAISGAYLPAAQDEPEQTTHVFARDLQSTLRSVQQQALPTLRETVDSLKVPVTLRRPRRNARMQLWRSAAISFMATVSLGLLGFAMVRALLLRLHRTPMQVTDLATAKNLAEPAPHSAVPPVAVASGVGAQSISDLSSDPPVPKLATLHAASGQAVSATDSHKPTIVKASVVAAAAPPSGVPSRAAMQTGQVFLTTPGGGQVFDKGRLLGRAPGSFELSPGWHTLVIKTGSEERSATVQVRADSSLMVSVPASALQP
ncbi:MAG TPA: hypothetical protein VJV79_34880 [Polyangiaceae bacterium]|nr:hypothetical protein [Polyangiaceae bacterium]